MGIWYGSVHTLAIVCKPVQEKLDRLTWGSQATTYTLVDLYSHEEYIEPLRNEVQGSLYDDFKKTADGLPLLDSFIRESARLSAFESSKSFQIHLPLKYPNTLPAGVRRQALTPFSFSDGFRVSVGDWICVPHRPMMRDSQYYENPLEFNAFRFINNTSTSSTDAVKPSKLTDASEDWLVWGAGRILWYVLHLIPPSHPAIHRQANNMFFLDSPGRFYATLVLKLVVAHLLRNYDCKLDPIKGSRSFQWRSAIIPKASLTLRIRPRTPVDSR